MSIKAYLIFFYLLLLTGCATNPPPVAKEGPCRSVTDDRYAFVGSWEGMIKHDAARHRRWVQNRFCDGTYSLQLYEFEDGYLVDFGQEVGRWWIKDATFFEQGHSWPLSEVHEYQYQFIEPYKIRFKRKDGYNFVDNKINSIDRPYLKPIPEVDPPDNSI